MSAFSNKIVHNLPKEPGIYKMSDHLGKILYIGKAKDIKKRVSSYFSKEHQNNKTKQLVKHIHHVDFIVTHDENEAYILENQLIKKHQPKYNVLLKDDKHYPYIKLTIQDVFPRLQIVRQKINDGALYFGPYSSIGPTRKIRQLLESLFMLRHCKQPISLSKKTSKCLQYDMGKCLGPCHKKDVKNRYDELVREAILFLSGKDKELIKKLQKQMNQHSNQLAFEKAALVRNKIQELEQITKVQHVDLGQLIHAEVWALTSSDDYYYVLVQQFIRGKLLAQEGYYLKRSDQMDRMTFFVQCFFKFNRDKKKSEILCDQEYCQVLLKIWPRLSIRKIKIFEPKRGIKKDILLQAKKNARLALQRLIRDLVDVKPGSKEKLLQQIKQQLCLSRVPKKMIGIDVSHLSGTGIVGAAVFFENGFPNKSFYRQYKIKTVKRKSNDPAAIYEVLTRLFKACHEQRLPFPDLCVIDGGKPQLHFALQAANESNNAQKCDIISIAKREEIIYSQKFIDGLQLSLHHPVRLMIQQVRDEVHRFVLAFQKKQRRNQQLYTKLSDIKGLGKKRVDSLYNKYKTVLKIKSLSVSELASCDLISIKLAEKILKELI